MKAHDAFDNGNFNFLIITSAGEHKFEKREISPSLEELQKAVGGYIRMVPFDSKSEVIQMAVNEDGLRLDLPDNPVASLLSGQRIVGDAVVLAGKARKRGLNAAN
jgi:hypothetical protein